MPTDTILTNLVRHDWLTDSPLESVVTTYIHELRSQRYADRTIRTYFGCLAHFGFWLNAEEYEFTHIDSSLVKRFLCEHLPACTCPAPCYASVGSSGAAHRHLLRLLSCSQPLPEMAQTPMTIELGQFGHYLTDTCGLTLSTRNSRIQHVGGFLANRCSIDTPDIFQLSATDVDAFCATLSSRLRPASLRIVCNSLRSYFRYSALRGDVTAGLTAALPRIADWRRAMQTLCGTKSKWVQQLPLPESTGEAVAQCLWQGARRRQTVGCSSGTEHRSISGSALQPSVIR
jgi:integrase/recombinase XerD